MPENGRLYQLVAELITEQRNTNQELKHLRQDFNTLFEELTVRVGRLEEAQKKTNVILLQQGRDLLKLANLLEEHVVHWGDKAQVGIGSKKIVGPIIRAD